MKLTRTDRGFEWLEHDNYLPEEDGPSSRLVSASSVIGDYDDSMARPGTSFLWFGDKHHLGREQVAELVERLRAWMESGSLAIEGDEASGTENSE